MENEIMEENISETPEVPVESEENNTVPETGVLPDTEIVEDVPETSLDVPETETFPDTSVVETETIPEESTEESMEESAEESMEESAKEIAPEESTEGLPGTEGTENEGIVEMENVNEDFYVSLSGNDAGSGNSLSSGADDTYVTNYYTMETEEVVPLWENNISNFSTSEMLLFLIFLLLLVQFIHKIFKGSHWLKG